VTLKINPTVAIVVVVILVAIAGFAMWQSFQGGASGAQASEASQVAIKKTTVEIPQATGAAAGMSAPPQSQGGTVSTPLMGPGGMTAPVEGR
jgi:predicted negative regulator of RcsB-dependent stress response